MQTVAPLLILQKIECYSLDKIKDWRWALGLERIGRYRENEDLLTIAF
jgi:hypothetical protein